MQLLSQHKYLSLFNPFTISQKTRSVKRQHDYFESVEKWIPPSGTTVLPVRGQTETNSVFIHSLYLFIIFRTWNWVVIKPFSEVVIMGKGDRTPPTPEEITMMEHQWWQQQQPSGQVSPALASVSTNAVCSLLCAATWWGPQSLGDEEMASRSQLRKWPEWKIPESSRFYFLPPEVRLSYHGLSLLPPLTTHILSA